MWTGAGLHFCKCYLLVLCLDYLAYRAVLWRSPKRLTRDGFWSVVYLPLDMFVVNSFTLQIQRPPPLTPHPHPQKSHFIRKQTARWFRFIFIIFLNYCFVGPMLEEVCLVFSGAEGTACVCLLTSSSRAAAWKLRQLLASHLPFSFPDFCMCGIWNPGDCLWSLVGVWKCVRTSSPRRYDVQKCAFGYPAAWFKWLQSLTETLPPSLATLWLLFHSVNLVLSKPKVSIKFLQK